MHRLVPAYQSPHPTPVISSEPPLDHILHSIMVETTIILVIISLHSFNEIGQVLYYLSVSVVSFFIVRMRIIIVLMSQDIL